VFRELHMCIYIKKDQQKRSIKETYKRDLYKRPATQSYFVAMADMCSVSCMCVCV